MATITITRWQCDRCGALHEREPGNLYGDRYECEVYEVSPSSIKRRAFVWRDLCHSCNSAVSRELDVMMETAAKARAEALAARTVVVK